MLLAAYFKAVSLHVAPAAQLLADIVLYIEMSSAGEIGIAFAADFCEMLFQALPEFEAVHWDAEVKLGDQFNQLSFGKLKYRTVHVSNILGDCFERMA